MQSGSWLTSASTSCVPYLSAASTMSRAPTTITSAVPKPTASTQASESASCTQVHGLVAFTRVKMGNISLHLASSSGDVALRCTHSMRDVSEKLKTVVRRETREKSSKLANSRKMLMMLKAWFKGFTATQEARKR
eukprot:10320-Heterococcus_DN1.PRE.1